MELVLFAEPMPRLPIEGLGEGMALTFQTDEHGVVLLGKLEGFSRIRVTLKSTPVTGRCLLPLMR